MTKLFNNTVSKADIMKRAWELARMNRKSFKVKARMTGEWLRMAWDEARTGNTHHWIWLNDANMLAHLENAEASARAEVNFRLASNLSAQISALQAKIAAANEPAPVELLLAA